MVFLFHSRNVGLVVNFVYCSPRRPGSNQCELTTKSLGTDNVVKAKRTPKVPWGTTHKKVVTTVRRSECACNRAGAPSVPFCERGGTSAAGERFFCIKNRNKRNLFRRALATWGWSQTSGLLLAWASELKPVSVYGTRPLASAINRLAICRPWHNPPRSLLLPPAAVTARFPLKSEGLF